MSINIPNLCVGNPQCYAGLTVFPLFAEPNGTAEYSLAEEALASGTAVIEEVSESGSVPDLLVDNRGVARILFLEGQELKGAKQNRILNTTVLVAAKSKLNIPVSCVEQGRWHYSDRQFHASGHHSTAKLRRSVKASVGDSLKASRGHRSDQGAVWNEVAALSSLMEVESQTAAMSDTFDAYEGRITEYANKLKYVDGATGLAVAIGGKIVSMDFFDKPSTCQQVWERLLSGMVFDAIETATTEPAATTTETEEFVSLVHNLSWQPVETVGEGAEFRAESPKGDHASALVLNDVIVHGSIMMAV